VATLTAQAHGCNVSFTWDELPYPPTVNDVAMQAMVSLTPALIPARLSPSDANPNHAITPVPAAWHITAPVLPDADL